MHGRADFPRALAIFDRVLRLFGVETARMRQRLLLGRAMSLGLFGEIEEAFTTLAEAKRIEASLPETSADAFIAQCEAQLRHAAAQSEQADECAHGATARFRAAPDPWGEVDLYQPIAAAVYTGRPTEAEALIRDLIPRAERVGHQNMLWLCRHYFAMTYMARGDLEQAERAASEALEYGRSISSAWLFAANALLGSIVHYRGRLNEAALLFRRGLEIEFRTYWSGLLAGGLFWTWPSKAIPPPRRRSPEPTRCCRFRVALCRWGPADVWHSSSKVSLGSAAANRLAPFKRNAEHVVANGPLCGYSQQLFRTSVGIAAASACNLSRAEEHYQAAIRQADAAPYRVVQPVARYWYAEMLLERRAPGDNGSARTQPSEALIMSESLGACRCTRAVSSRHRAR